MALSLFTFSGGQVLAASSDASAAAVIKEALGLDAELYRASKKNEMLEDPLKYLKNRYAVLKGVADETQGTFAQALANVNEKLDVEFRDTEMARAKALQLAASRMAAKKILVDLQYPVTDKATKFMKNANKKKKQLKKEVISEALA